MSDIGDRIKLLVDNKAGGKNTAFAAIVGVSEANIRGYIKGIMPKADVLEKIVRSCEINAEWLLTGEGTMLKGEGHVAPSEVRPSEKKSTVGAPDAATLMALLHDKDATIRQLSEQIGILKERIRGIERNKAKTASPALDTPDALIG